MMERDRITEHVKEITPYLEQKLDALVEKYDFLTARRGLGLMQGVVCEKPVGKIASAALEHGLVVITAGTDVLRFVPPAVFITAIPVIPSTTTSPAAVSLLYNRFILFP